MRKLVLAVAVVALAVAPPAAEGAKPKILGKSGGFIYAKDVETVPGVASGSATANSRCPRETVSVAGGASISGPIADSFLSLTSKVSERQWYVEGWHIAFDPAKLSSYAICSKRVGKYYDDTEGTSVGAGPNSVGLSAPCIDGHVIGGGARPIGAPDDWSINSSFPIDDSSDPDGDADNAWRTFAEHRDGSDPSTFLADSQCMSGAPPEYVVTEGENVGGLGVTLKARCPDDTVVIGGGAYVSGDVTDAHLVSTRPFDTKQDKGKLPADGWKATFSNDDVPALLDYEVTAVCK